MNRIFIIGSPHTTGGAGPECWGAIQLWRKAGVEVTLLPAGPMWAFDTSPDGKLWRKKVEDIGCKIIEISKDVPGGLSKVPGLEGATVASFCCGWFVFPDVYSILKKLNCRLIWSATMCHSSEPENKTFADFGLPDHLIYQSLYQRHSFESMLIGGLAANGFTGDPYDEVTKRGVLIRGAFDVSEWEFKPKEHDWRKNQPFVIGKLAAPRPDKWHPRLWRIFEKVPYPYKASIVMGMDTKIAENLGPMPDWAHWVQRETWPVKDYYDKIHVMAALQEIDENRSRVALESFALGVPVVAPRNSGWVEMIQHGVNGYLAESDEHAAFLISELIYRPRKRDQMVREARLMLEDTIADQNEIEQEWMRLLIGNCVAESRAAV